MSNSADSIRDRLELIIDSISHIENYVENIHTANDFLISPGGMLRLDACVMRLQVIGETVRSLLAVTNNPLEGHPEIEWRQIVGLRNLISHEYISLDEELVFQIIRDELPRLRHVVEQILREI